MKRDQAFYYRALKARDPRFDGVFFVGVTSTRIYCRPVCPAKTPKRANCRFFESPQAAEKHEFRPCLRCRPELAPGLAPMDDTKRVAHQLVQRMEQGLIDESANLEDIARHFDLSARQIRRIVRQEMGVSPIALMQSRRLLLAKQLLTETTLPITEIAYASGFASLRRFNDAFRAHYRMPPTRLRRKIAARDDAGGEGEASTVQMIYRPPYDWEGVRAFLKARALRGAEWVSDTAYARTVRLGQRRGWIEVTHAPEKRALLVRFSHALTPALPALLGRLRNLFDLEARPDLIAAHLAKSPALKSLVKTNPGLRVPGAFDGFELAVRAILGQQVTVKAATTLACRFVEAFGDEIATPFPALTRLAPTSEKVAHLTVTEIARLGTIAARARAIIALAQACVDGRVDLGAGANVDGQMRHLASVPGLGPWTRHYIAMRAMRWPDAFPKEDVAVRKRLGGVNAKEADQIAEMWRPWRSYGVLHLWNSRS